MYNTLVNASASLKVAERRHLCRLKDFSARRCEMTIRGGLLSLLLSRGFLPFVMLIFTF